MDNTSDFLQPKFNTSSAVRILILLSLALAGLIICSVAMMIMGINMNSISDMYYTIVVQDLFAFIIPAIAAMAICFHKPLQAMSLTTAPSWRGIVVAILVCLISLPAMNWLVEWNQNIKLPDSLSSLEEIMRSMEDTAQAVTDGMMKGESVGTLLINLIVVAFLAGLSEELFFRGSMLKMLTPNKRHMHLAIWVVAFVFSVLHMQFYGFVPRMLLGAWFGYLLWWTRSLWVPIIAHALNNSIVVVATWLDSRGLIDSNAADSIGIPADGSFPWLALCSAILTILVIVYAAKIFSQKNKA